MKEIRSRPKTLKLQFKNNMHIYSISPDINKRGTFDDEFDEWRFGCFKSKWDKHREDEEWDEEENPVFDSSILKEE